MTRNALRLCGLWMPERNEQPLQERPLYRFTRLCISEAEPLTAASVDVLECVASRVAFAFEDTESKG